MINAFLTSKLLLLVPLAAGTPINGDDVRSWINTALNVAMIFIAQRAADRAGKGAATADAVQEKLEEVRKSIGTRNTDG